MNFNWTRKMFGLLLPLFGICVGQINLTNVALTHMLQKSPFVVYKAETVLINDLLEVDLK